MNVREKRIMKGISTDLDDIVVMFLRDDPNIVVVPNAQKDISEVADIITRLKTFVSYVLFDLEATRREKVVLTRMLGE